MDNTTTNRETLNQEVDCYGRVHLVCSCGGLFRRYASKVKPGRYYFCSASCKRAHTERAEGTSRCAQCGEWKTPSEFSWLTDSRYAAGGHRSSYCSACKLARTRAYHERPENKAKAHDAHAAWRERALNEGGDKALKWYFTRQMGGYKKRSQELGISCDLTASYLVSLFHQQQGKCFFTNIEMRWNNYGRKVPSPDSLSVDRLEPSKGYIQGNVVLCTYQANTSKGARTEAEFYAFCEEVLRVRGMRT